MEVAIQPGQPDHRPTVAGRAAVGDHLRDVHSDVGTEVGLVDHQQVRAADARPALAGDVTTAGHVQHEDLRVDQRR